MRGGLDADILDLEHKRSVANLNYQLGECELQGDCAAPRQPNFDSNPDGNGVRGRFASSYVESFEQIVSSTGSAKEFAE